MKKNKIIKEIRNWVFPILGAVLIASLINSKVFARVQVQQSSMENTLYSSQQLIVDKLTYNFAGPKRGDIIIFLENEQRGTIIDDTVIFFNNIKSLLKNTDEDKRLVKRVIGVPGDEVNIKDGYVYINGEKLNEPYVKGETFNQELSLPINVPANKLFVLGDNRPVSKDSRAFGLINYNQVEGKAVFRVFPFNKIGSIK
ncbi:signal peptidase I [Clostridium estertheticum]|uniref:signal peptidase I n=1 Tax=Clostridium estertheticum TaxID=238834 RepID=UPI0013E9931E|nr:signal peptidase I [Clostridium estertheticum]MBZ9687135.1 signal peptidase I [Clostridium estertheticum]